MNWYSFTTDFHFLRPLWLLALFLVPAYFLLKRKGKVHGGAWAQIVSEHLLPFLLIPPTGRPHKLYPVIYSVILGLACFALAGPTFERLAEPARQNANASVIVLSLAPTMNATDISPTRLERAKHKIKDYLKLKKDGVTALVVYAGDAHVVSPLTQDKATIENLLSVVDSTIMPVPGNRADVGLETARRLLQSVGGGNIVFFADGASLASTQKLTNQETVSVLGIGTNQGGPVLLANGQFLKDTSGNVTIASLDEPGLRTLASTNGGVYVPMSATDDDVERIIATARATDFEAPSTSALLFDRWRDLGPYLVLLMLPLVLLLFRRGAISTLLLFSLFGTPQASHATFWDDLWSTRDQQGQLAIKDNPKEAAKLFKSEDWRALAHYKAGDFEKAAEGFGKLKSADAQYNRGNALAKMGKIDEAIAAYDGALKLNKDHADAQFNKDLLEKLKNEQEKQKQQQEQQQQQDKSQKNEESGDKKEPSDQMSNQEKDALKKQAEQENKQDPSEQKQPEQNPQDKGPDKAQEDAKQEQQPQDIFEQQPNKDADEAEKDKTLNYWLDKIPDDPAGLLRRKFYLESQKRQAGEGR